MKLLGISVPFRSAVSKVTPVLMVQGSQNPSLTSLFSRKGQRHMLVFHWPELRFCKAQLYSICLRAQLKYGVCYYRKGERGILGLSPQSLPEKYMLKRNYLQ